MLKKLLILSLSSLYIPILCAQRPGGVPDSLTVWLKANEGVTLNPTNQVTSWTEYSTAGILGNFSTQGAAINKPTHVAPGFDPSAINFNPYILFNNGTAVNSISSGNAVAGLQFLDATSNTIFQVFNMKQTTGTGVWLKWQWQTNPYSGPRLGNEVNNPGNLGQIRFDFRNPTIYTPVSVANTHSLVTEAITATNKFIRLTGQERINVAASGTFSPGSTQGRLTIGAEPYGDNYPTNIDYAELIIYKRALTPAEINKVESYLAIKYGFTLEQVAVANNYVGSDGTILWNSTANSAYRYNITGIARDDNSALHQKQSKSINAGTIVTIYKNGTYGGTFPTANADNTQAFSADKNYLLFGDDNGALTLNACADNGRIVRLNRVWKMITTGTDGLATIALDKAGIPADVKTLVVADDPAFNTNVATVNLNDNGTVLYAAHTFAGEKYFTFGTVPMALNAKADTVCFGELGNITSAPTGGLAPVTYTWNSIPPQTTASLTGVPNGTYTVNITQGGGICSFSETHTIVGSESSIEVMVTGIQPTFCSAETGSVTLFASGGTPPYYYSTDNITYNTGNTIEKLGYGNHRIYVRDYLGCLKDITVFIPRDSVILDMHTETADAWCDANGGAGRAIVKVRNGNAPYQYMWNNGIGLHPYKHEDLKKGDYEIVVTDRLGCTGKTTFSINEIPCCTYFIPTAFSPNGDGLNDIFEFKSSIPLPHFHMTVFNRYGGTIFVSGNDNVGWDGRDYKTGAAADAGVYFYYIKYQCPLMKETQTLKGEVTLLR